MYLSNRDIKWAIDCGKLTVDPRPENLVPAKGYDETSIDLHLGPINTARVWNLDELRQSDRARGATTKDQPPELYIGTFEWEGMADRYLIPVPEGERTTEGERRLVYGRSNEIVVRQLGFLLWTTRERIGTPKVMPDYFTGPRRHPELICFINGKSTRTRTGLLIHFTAPTIHAGWEGNVTLEISNLGPFTFVLREGDPLAQLTVATIASAPDLRLKVGKSQTEGQENPSGTPRTRRPKKQKS